MWIIVGSLMEYIRSRSTVINIRIVNLDVLEQENIWTSAVHYQKVPPLLGVSVLNRLDKIEIDNFVFPF